MDVRKYLYNWQLDDDFIERMETFAVWRGRADGITNALFIMKGHEVYAAGKIVKQCANNPLPESTSQQINYYEPTKLSLLCGKVFKKFVIGSTYSIFIFDGNGEVYVCGDNISLQRVPVFQDMCVIDIAIVPGGKNLALCTDGPLYSFDLDLQLKYQINTSAANAKPVSIVHVTGYNNFSMSIALFEDGKVMRIINDDALNNRCEEVGFQNAASRGKIEKLVQGYMHVFALDEHGSLFVIGLNHEGQLGLGKRDQYRADEFEQVSVINEKIVDVAASCFSCLSTALTESGKVYIWGNNRGVCIFEPRLTPFSSLHEAFFVCSEPWVTCRPINVGELPAITSKPENLLVGSFEKAFRDPIGTSE